MNLGGIILAVSRSFLSTLLPAELYEKLISLLVSLPCDFALLVWIMYR